MKWNKLYEKAESISLKITKVIEPVVSDSGILIEEVSKLIKSMATDVRDFTRTCRDLFKRAMEAGLEVRLRQVFGVSPRELVKVGETSAQIDIKGTCGNLHISLTDSVAVDRLDLCIDNVTEDEFLSIIKFLVIYIALDIYKFYIIEELKKQFTAYDYIIATMMFLTRKIIDEYGVLSPAISGKFGSVDMMYLIDMSIRGPVYEVFLPGSRACIVHALPRPEMFTPGPRDKMSVSDREFTDVYARLIDEYRRSRKLTESANLLLRDMGIELDIATQWGEPVVYIKRNM